MRDRMDIRRLAILCLPYVFLFWFFSKAAESCRLSAGADMAEKIMAAVSGLGDTIAGNPFPCFYPSDVLIGIAGAAAVRAAVYIKGRNAKKYRHGVEYGSARWGA